MFRKHGMSRSRSFAAAVAAIVYPLALLGVAQPRVALAQSETQTGIFGLTGSGSRFVYVFDRSGSMGDYNNRPLNAAKRELLASLEHLDSVHQFQVIFYNERVSAVNMTRGGGARMLFGGERGKDDASEFIRGMTAAGGSHHLEALQTALRLEPDVIFFLTDAGEPGMSREDVAKINEMNEGIGAQIHSIEFGDGADSGDDNFLRQIADKNRGEHVYIDINELKK
jgi:hypothetical protein